MKWVMHIITGWGKRMGMIPVTTAEKKLSDIRMRFCKTCDDSSVSKVLSIVAGQASYESQLKCDKCGCPCLQKTLIVDEQCPVNKW